MPWLIISEAILLALLGQTSPEGPGRIVTDRPDFTESSIVVPAGSTQIESGFTWTREDKENSAFGGPEVLIRFGMTERFELRLGLPNYNSIDSAGLPQSRGWDDLYAGFKVQLGPTRDGTDLALIAAIFIPVGQDGIRSEAVSPEVKFCWSRDAGSGKALSGMIYVARTEVGGKRADLLQHTVSLGLPIRENVGMFIEHVLDVSNGVRPSQLLHCGLTFQPRQNVQFDIHFGFGLSPNAPNYFVAGGYSIRF